MKRLTILAALLTMVFAKSSADDLVTPPANLLTETYVAILTTKAGETYYQNVQIGFYNNDGVDEVYFQGLAYNGVPESWVKGTFDETGMFLNIPSTFLGTSSFLGTGYNYTFNETVFLYYSSDDRFYAPAGYSITGGVGAETYATATLKILKDKAATPAKPVIEFSTSPNGSTYIIYMTIPLVDTDGNPIDCNKLSYILYYEKDGAVNELTFTKDLYKKLETNMTEIPYTYTDYYDIDNYQIWMNQSKDELKSWTRIGVKSIYRGGGETHESEVAWYDLATFWNTGIDNITLDTNAPKRIFNLNGQKLQAPRPGLNIINGKKVLVK